MRYAGWMQERGHKVTLFTVDNSPLAVNAQERGFTLEYIKKQPQYAYLPSAFRAEKRMRKLGIELIWIRDTRDMGIAGFVGKRLKVPVLYQQAMQLGVDKHDFFHTRRFKRITAWVATLDFLYKQVLERTQFPESRLHMIPLGLDTTRFEDQISQREAREKWDLPQDVPIVGIVGRIDPLKGQDTLIKAMGLVEDKNCHAVIVGELTRNHEKYYIEQLKNLRRRNRVIDRVHFRPFSDEVQHAYTAMDFFTMCSAGETFGMVTIEAMASGKGVIGTNTAGTPEILNYGECGEFFTPYDHIELARVINRWLQDPEKVRNYGIHGRERAKKLYAKDVVLDQLEDLARRLVAGLPKRS